MLLSRIIQNIRCIVLTSIEFIGLLISDLCKSRDSVSTNIPDTVIHETETKISVEEPTESELKTLKDAVLTSDLSVVHQENQQLKSERVIEQETTSVETNSVDQFEVL